VINIKPRAGEYVNSWSDFRFLPAVFDWVRLIRALDYLVIVVTNQRGVARGITRESELSEIHRRMCEEMSREGAELDDVFVCPHEEGVCECRKPRPGLVLRAQQKWSIDLPRSLLIGDSDCDAELARCCGLRFVRVADGRIQQVLIPGVKGPPSR
jgi:histidinol-phosphate phosphatase family protein